MNNKIMIPLIIQLLFCSTVYNQERQIGVSYTRNIIDMDFDFSKVFMKKTGAKVSEKEFHILVQENPNLYLEGEFDEEGNVLRYLYDPDDQNENGVPYLHKKVLAKGPFPNFRLTTIDQKKIELKELHGKLVILRFELYANNFRFKKHEIQELDNKINALKDKEKVKSIIIFGCSESEIQNGFDLKNSNFEIVAEGQNFIEKYGITFFPSTLLIDQNGNLIEKYSYSEDINLEEHLKE